MKFLFIILLVISLASVCSSNNANSQSSNNLTVLANDTCKKIDAYLSQLEKDKNFSGGLLIIKNGIKIFSKGYGWADKENKIS